jgi:thiazole synthase
LDGHIAGEDTQVTEDTWTVAGRTFRSRLIVGTGRYKDLEETGAAIEASGAEIVTVAVRRVNLSDPKAPMLQDYVDPKKYTYLPNTAGCFTAREAVRTLRLARTIADLDGADAVRRLHVAEALIYRRTGVAADAVGA